MEQENTAVVEWVDIVDEKNEVVAQATRQQMRAENLRHRATYIVVHDGMGKFWHNAVLKQKISIQVG